MKRFVPHLIRGILSSMMLMCAAMCIFWLPRFVEYVNGFLGLPKMLLGVFGALVAIPLFIIFALAFAFPCAIENDCIFGLGTSARLQTISVLLFADCLFFCVGIFLLLVSGEVLLSPVLGSAGLIGLVVAYVLSLLSEYIKSAAALKEEVDATL